eukprot:SAG31_NODE_230_length_19771_cov_90.041739_4_plen_388_part_00
MDGCVQHQLVRRPKTTSRTGPLHLSARGSQFASQLLPQILPHCPEYGRCCNRSQDVYLLDDPLSAVDAHTGHHIFHDCILGLLKNKTVLLPCHAVSFLKHTDHIISLADNRILEQGSYKALLATGGDFADLMQKHAKVTADEDEEIALPETSTTDEAKTEAATEVSAHTAKDKNSQNKRREDGDGKIVKAEARDKGGVKSAVYAFYAHQVGVRSVFFVLFCFISAQATQVFSDWWMSRWSVQDMNLVPGDPEAWSTVQIMAWFLAFYAVGGVVVVIFTVLKVLVIQIIGFNASRKIHRRLLWRLMKAPVKYFDVTPVGRIVNRFSSDMSDIDNSISQNFMQVFGSTLSLVSGFGLVLSMLPGFVVWLVPLFYGYWETQKKYRQVTFT